jgi:hypothetical protein
MLLASKLSFNQAALNRRLKHYFADSAPCTIEYELGMSWVKICNIDNDSIIHFDLDPKVSEEANVRTIISKCEDEIYPFVAKPVEKVIPLPPDEIVTLLNKGKTFIEAMDMAEHQIVRNNYIITRIGLNNNTLVLRDLENESKVYELKYMPALKFLEGLNEGKFTPETGYDYIMQNSIVKELL